MKNNRGITLIALVITIIVMLILTGVTITAVVSGGLLDNARKASFQTAMAKYDEELQTYIAGEKTRAISEGTTYTLPTLTTAAAIKAIIPSFSDKYEGEMVIQDGQMAYLGENPNELLWASELNLGKQKTVFDFTATYENIYVHPTPTGVERVTFSLNATATGDSTERQWDFDFDTDGGEMFSIQTFLNANVDETNTGTVEIENYIYLKEEKEITLGETLTLPAGWSHNNITAIVTNGVITGMQEGSTTDVISYSEVPAFSDATFYTDKEIDVEDGEPTFESIEDLINNYISDSPYRY